MLAAVAVLLLWATTPRKSAEDAVQEYLDAIAAGDIERANELVPAVPDLGTPPTADGRTTAATAGWTPISDPQVVDSFEIVEGVQVEVSYVVGYSTHTASLSVVPEEDPGIFAEGWQVMTPLSLNIGVDSPSGALPFTIGDLEIQAGRDAKVTLYPGSYQVAFEGGDYLAGDEHTLDAVPTSNGDVARIRVMPEFTTTMSEELIEYVRTALETCTALDGGYVSQCGMHANQDRDGVTLDPVTWTVVDGPVISEDSRTDIAELRTTLRAEYEVADDPSGPGTPVTEEIVLRTQVLVTYESADSYQVLDLDWHTMPTGS